MLIDTVAELAALPVWRDVPESAVAATRRCTLHVLATTRLGARRAIARQVRDYVAATSSGVATVVGRGDAGAAPGEAAFANATMCHADFRDDAHAPSQSHPGVTVIPAALAAAEVMGGRLPEGTLGGAIVAGYQVIGRLGRLAAIRSTERGFRASAIYTVFGAAVAAARVLGLDHDRLRSAIALAAQGAAGLNQPYLDGSDDWILLPGLAARHGLTAALLAREGVTGAPGILDGPLGFFRAYAGIERPGALEAAGLPAWEVEATRLKPVLTCGWNQAAVNLLLESGIAADDIAELDVTLSPEAFDFAGVTNRGPFTTFTSAVLSLPFALGSLLRTGGLDTATYDDLADPRVAAGVQRVRVRSRADLVGYDTELTVVARDGSRTLLRAPGAMPRWLLRWDEVVGGLEAKYATAGLDRSAVAALARAIPDALDGTRVGELMRLLAQPVGSVVTV